MPDRVAGGAGDIRIDSAVGAGDDRDGERQAAGDQQARTAPARRRRPPQDIDGTDAFDRRDRFRPAGARHEPCKSLGLCGRRHQGDVTIGRA